MRAMGATRTWSLSCRRALIAIAGVALAGAASADADRPSGLAPNQLASVQEGSNPPPANISPRPAVTDVSAELPRGGNGGDDHRLFMLMMMGRVMSGGPFGRLGQ